jgi:hypothetical protein
VQSSATKQVSVANLTAGRSVSGTSFVPTGSTIPANGLYLPAANSVGLATNTTNAVYVDSSQNVVVGASGTINAERFAVWAVSGSGIKQAVIINNSHGYGVGVGTASSALTFTRARNTSEFGPMSQIVSGNETETTDAFGFMAFYTTSTTQQERMRIASTGIVTMNAYGVGSATFSAAGVISSVSDETWKIKDGVPVDPDSMLKKLEPGYWYYNDEKKEIFGVDRQLGFYAQNVNAAIGPEAAPTPEEGKPWGYYDRSVLAITVMSLQKALETIESLTARIVALETKIPA